jgi:hypothetical protein
MAKATRSRPKSGRTARRALVPRRISPEQRASRPEVRSLVRWVEIGRVAEALAETVSGDAAEAQRTVTSLLRRLTAPHHLLARLHDLSKPVFDGDSNAADELRSRVAEILERIPHALELARVLQADTGLTEIRDARDADQPQSPQSLANRSIDEAGLLNLLVAVSKVFTHEVEERHADAVNAALAVCGKT